MNVVSVDLDKYPQHAEALRRHALHLVHGGATAQIAQDTADRILRGEPPHQPPEARKPNHGNRKPPLPGVRCLAAERPGPGRVLHQAIKRLTGQDVTPGCKCCRRIEVMNEKGWAWCIANRGTILGWLREEGEKRGIEMSDATVRAALAAAWREWRKPV